MTNAKNKVPRAWDLEYRHVDMSMDKPIVLSNTEGTRGPQVKNAKNEMKKKTSPELGNQHMNMSMDKPIALSKTEGTRGPQVKNAKNEIKQKDVPRAWELEYEHVHGQTDSAE